ncbi:uncharacterized protein LOC117168044 isoform X2 [Belonocnema kinseyi]|uniref:uncharacterized protein LOC117168044 isoform X2 n=1 Tax=Belonocnema kinseyi TaxID=2817044 RepID=UPI00143D3920|nr:uncharacterized protein LOC117168044 isoform X2 [Belonocnema kinseyi]
MSRPILSRPRTRVYGCNYDKGESYYKPMMDHLDRKYSGRPLFSEPRTSLADEIAARRSDIGSRGIAGNYNEYDDSDYLFDGRSRAIPEEGSDDEFLSTHRRFKDRAAAAFEEDLAELRRKRRDMQDRMFDMIDLNAEIERAKTTLEQADSAFQRHSMKFNNEEENVENMSLVQRMDRNRKLAAAEISDKPAPKPMTKWSLINSPEREEPSTVRSRVNSLIAANVLSDNPSINPYSNASKRKKSVSF